MLVQKQFGSRLFWTIVLIVLSFVAFSSSVPAEVSGSNIPSAGSQSTLLQRAGRCACSLKSEKIGKTLNMGGIGCSGAPGDCGGLPEP
jgi:hypothetical protein